MELHSEQHNRAYWHNTDTGETSWVQPDGAMAATADPLQGTTPTTTATAATTANPVHGSLEDDDAAGHPPGWSQNWHEEHQAGLDEGLLSYCPSPISFIWRISIVTRNASDE